MTLEYMGWAGVTTRAGWLQTLRRYWSALKKKIYRWSQLIKSTGRYACIYLENVGVVCIPLFLVVLIGIKLRPCTGRTLFTHLLLDMLLSSAPSKVLIELDLQAQKKDLDKKKNIQNQINRLLKFC